MFVISARVLGDELLFNVINDFEESMCSFLFCSYYKNIMRKSGPCTCFIWASCVEPLWYSLYIKVFVNWDPLCKIVFVFFTALKQVIEHHKRYLNLLLDLVNLLVLQIILPGKDFLIPIAMLVSLCQRNLLNTFWCCSVVWLSNLWFYTLSVDYFEH